MCLNASFVNMAVDSIPSHVAPLHPIKVDRGYQPYNKPAAIMDWMAKVNPPEDVSHCSLMKH